MSLQYAEAVHRLAAGIPSGSVLTYGDIAELLGAGGPRQVGAAMAHSDGELPWWRVLRANGTLRADLQERALPHWIDEEIPLRGSRVLVGGARWQPGDAGFAFIESIAADLAAGLAAGQDTGGGPNYRGRVL
ncbi:MGMT family protein [Arthrobacter sp.]|uniref:MGMT family protein n=1 Tax=Arthrobacter sp. TaxID=1667 RepID=UPI003A951735